MKLVRYGPALEECPGVIDSAGRIRALQPLVDDFTYDKMTPEWLAALAAIDVEKLPLVDGQPRLGVPVAGIRQIIAIGLNYADHAAEGGMEIPEYPLVFAKAVGSLSGQTDPVAVPRSAEKLDWEVELAFLVGTAGRDIPVETALDHVAGYGVLIDFSERVWQMERGGQIGKGKSLDGFAPFGPWFVTTDEIRDPQNLDLWLDVNDEARQRGNTRDMAFSVAELIAHVSQYQTLLPGDLVTTGSPAGFGGARKPPQFLHPGDCVTCGGGGLGDQRHMIVVRP